MKKTVLSLLALAALGAASIASAAPASACPVSLTNDPVVMRLNKDEFRIVFGVNGDQCVADGCSGVIHYKAAWKTEDGATSTDSKLLNYTVPRGASRTIAVDRHYFDTAEGQHTTEIVKVSVDDVSCTDRVAMR
ncbi:MAG: hypothetical protein ABI843_00145 [Dokdonella sp.]